MHNKQYYFKEQRRDSSSGIKHVTAALEEVCLQQHRISSELD